MLIALDFDHIDVNAPLTSLVSVGNGFLFISREPSACLLGYDLKWWDYAFPSLFPDSSSVILYHYKSRSNMRHVTNTTFMLVIYSILSNEENMENSRRFSIRSVYFLCLNMKKYRTYISEKLWVVNHLQTTITFYRIVWFW